MARNLPDELEDALGAIESAQRAINNPGSYALADALAFLDTAKSKLEWAKEVTTPAPRSEDRDFDREFQD